MANSTVAVPDLLKAPMQVPPFGNRAENMCLPAFAGNRSCGCFVQKGADIFLRNDAWLSGYRNLNCCIANPLELVLLENCQSIGREGTVIELD